MMFSLSHICKYVQLCIELLLSSLPIQMWQGVDEEEKERESSDKVLLL